MTQVLVLGAGKIGRMIARLLVDSGDFEVTVGDVDAVALDRVRQRTGAEVQRLDADSDESLCAAMHESDVVVSALGFRWNPGVARAALVAGVSYFDLTEDVATTLTVRELAAHARAGQVFVPQCGLAPGFVSIVARHLYDQFEEIDRVSLRAGVLPKFPDNRLRYNLTWSTDGLINEYCNPCPAIYEGRQIDLLPLEGLEHVAVDGMDYEAFNTSGGIGTLCETLDGRARDVAYRTIRYPGHRDLMSFLLTDLRLSGRRELLREVLEAAVPVTFQDVVITFCSVTGRRGGQFAELSDVRKVYGQTLAGERWSGVQITTAASVCTMIDLHRNGRLPARGFVRQEDVVLDEFLANRFGRYFAGGASK
ncbi:MAG: saccharopine dehydrogenase NADP-binding domain-containing protein [Planctomycetota bacterium]|nr:saccharopine dehydrogenase NADP-binding domain-containing protein [Planctomycetota bacterium]